MRRGKFCPKCGKSVEKLYGDLCSDCFLAQLGLTDKIPDKVVLGTCKMCGKTYLKEEKFFSAESAINKLLQQILKQKGIATASYRIQGSMLFLTIVVESEGLQKEIEKHVPIVNKSITCRFCNLQKASYYNVTIQIRVPKNMREKIVQEAQDLIKRFGETDKYSFVSGVDELKEGVDLFVGSKGAAERVVNMLKRKYRAKTKISRKLYGLIEGKKSYRDTMLLSIED